jgi:hypothetical protein
MINDFLTQEIVLQRWEQIMSFMIVFIVLDLIHFLLTRRPLKRMARAAERLDRPRHKAAPPTRTDYDQGGRLQPGFSVVRNDQPEVETVQVPLRDLMADEPHHTQPDLNLRFTCPEPGCGKTVAKHLALEHMRTVHRRLV